VSEGIPSPALKPTATAASAAKKRRRFQFGLRGWILFITAVSITLGIAGRCYDRVRRQKAAIGFLQSRGFSVTHQVPMGLTQWALGESPDTWPLWQRYLLLDVESVGQIPARSRGRPELGEEFWDQLSQFPKITSLSINDPLPKGLRLDQMPFRRHIRNVFLTQALQAQDIEQLSDCPQLVTLDIRAGLDTDASLARLGRLKHLEQLTISHASPEAVDAWCQWSKLQNLTVVRAGSAPSEKWARLIENNPELRTLSLRGITTAYKVCDALKNSSELAWLDLGKSDVGDSGVEVLATLPKLRVLHLDETRVTGIGFEPLEADDWPELHSIRLSKAAVNAEGVLSLVKVPHLHEIDLAGNKLDDSAFCELPVPFTVANVILAATDITDATVERLVDDGVLSILANDTFATKGTAHYLEKTNKRRVIHISTKPRRR
jgi:hypothetical protein